MPYARIGPLPADRDEPPTSEPAGGRCWAANLVAAAGDVRLLPLLAVDPSPGL